MLLQLRIDNFAVIEHCLIDFEPGFVALTGETGAGKSILIDALSGCLGSRMGLDVIRVGAARAEIEALFSRSGAPDDITVTLNEVGIEDGEVLILAREVTQSGRTVCRVNGRAVPVSILATIGANLIDLHGQSEHLSLLKPARQLDMLDHFGSLDSLRSEFQAAAADLVRARRRLQEMDVNRRSAEQNLDLLRYKVKEIEDAAIREGEIEELSEERTRLANAEKLVSLATQALVGLDGDEVHRAAVDALADASNALRQLVGIDRSLEKEYETSEELRFALRDLAATVRRYRDGLESNPLRLNEVESRLDEINRLLRKYGDTVDTVLAVLEDARSKVDQADNYDDRLNEAAEHVRTAENAAAELARALSEQRHIAAERFVTEVRQRLAKLGLGPALFEVSISQVNSADGVPSMDGEKVAFTASGIDQIRFLVSFNAGESLKPIERVASGGETARFMLAVKAVLAASDDVPTLIFDEIDTGVGGRSGSVVGTMLAALGRSHQVFSITHLPQIAALAEQHLKVVKHEKAGHAQTTVVQLKGDERIRELAEMISGSPPSRVAVEAAAELLSGVVPAEISA